VFACLFCFALLSFELHSTLLPMKTHTTILKSVTICRALYMGCIKHSCAPSAVLKKTLMFKTPLHSSAEFLFWQQQCRFVHESELFWKTALFLQSIYSHLPSRRTGFRMALGNQNLRILNNLIQNDVIFACNLCTSFCTF
jgi:hypothetical protein